MPRLLSKLKITEVSSVNKPANAGAKILLMKSLADDRYAEPRGRKTLFEHQEAARAAYEAARGKKGKNKMNKMISVAKHVLEGGTLVSHNRDDFFRAMQEGAEKIKKSGETSAQAFARFAGEPDGKVLMAAMKIAPPAAGAPPQMATTALSAPYRQLLDRARELRQRDPRLTEAQAFERVHRDNPDLAGADKAEHVSRATALAKRGVGEKPPAVSTADADADELHDRIRRKAAKLQRKNPSLTPAQALMAIFESRKPKDRELVTKYISAAA